MLPIFLSFCSFFFHYLFENIIPILHIHYINSFNFKNIVIIKCSGIANISHTAQGSRSIIVYIFLSAPTYSFKYKTVMEFKNFITDNTSNAVIDPNNTILTDFNNI